MTLLRSTLIALLLLTSPAHSIGRKPTMSAWPTVFCLDPNALNEARTRLKRGDPALQPALEQLVQAADRALTAGPFSVLQKTRVPPSGDKHDYMSIGPYWWPDPDKPNGLPYINRDGQINPESRTGSDSPARGRMTSAVETLALAYFFTGNEAYAEHAAHLLRVWFLDPETKMNPHLNYGQGIPGRAEGRSTGIIDTASLPRIVDAIGLLASSQAWTQQDQEGMVAWFDAYQTWLRKGRYADARAHAQNNIGSWWDVQIASMAAFAGKPDIAREILEAVPTRLIAAQIEPDGAQPRELRRTRAFGYSIGNLRALVTLASLGDRMGIDLWHFATDDGRSIRKAIDFLTPYADPEKEWPYQQISGMDATALLPLLLQANRAYGDQPYSELIHQLVSQAPANRALLLFPPPANQQGTR